MSGIVFCCCSSGRSELLVQKTLKSLARGQFSSVLWLVVPSEEVTAYTEKVTGNQVMCMIQAAPERGLVKQRKFFREQMAPGTEIVFIDDDIEAIKIKGPDGLRHVTRVEAMAEYVFQTMHNHDALLAGVYPMANRDWQKHIIFKSNSYIVGALYFCVNDNRLVEPDEDELEDWARCLSEQAAGRSVLRFNFFGIQTKYWANPGGLQTDRTDQKRMAAIQSLLTRFPGLIKRKLRKNGKEDLAFISRPEHSEAPLL